MAIFHLNVSVIKRESKHKKNSIVAAAAYRHRCEMTTIDGSQKFRYSRKKNDLVDEFFVIPNTSKKILNGLKNAPPSEASEFIWNIVEGIEKRKDSQFAREVEVSLHHDLTLEQNKTLLQEFINKNFVSKGMIADVAIHNPENKNLHAHILLTMRDIDNSTTAIFGKKNREWNNPELVNVWRQSWEYLSNEYLAKANVKAQISCKTLKEQKEIALQTKDYVKASELDREPCTHIQRNKVNYDEQGLKIDFVDAIKLRTQKRLQRIKENVSKYLQNRAAEFSATLAKVRTRANATISNVTNSARKQQQRILTAIIERSNQQSNSTARTATTTRSQNSEWNQEIPSNNQSAKPKEPKSLLDELDARLGNLKQHKQLNPKFKP